MTEVIQSGGETGIQSYFENPPHEEADSSRLSATQLVKQLFKFDFLKQPQGLFE
jgi:hypothetical protein